MILFSHAVFDPIEAMQPDAPEIHLRHPKITEPFRNIGGKTSQVGEISKRAFRSPTT